jgi:hypothetical protein
VAKRTNEKHNCWINIYSFIIESMSPCTYTMYCTGNHKTQTLWSFVNRGIFERRTTTNFIIRTPEGRQIWFRTFLNVSCLFRFPRNTKGQLILGHYPKLKLSWNAKIEIVHFCEKWQFISYKFDQPCFSIFLLNFKALRRIQTFVSHIILHNIFRAVYQNLS